MTDYSKIQADPVWGAEIGRLYTEASPHITTLARYAYVSMSLQLERQFSELSSDVRVSFVEDDPYENADALFRDIRRGRMAVWSTPEEHRHPLLGCRMNNLFRAVHDYYGHWKTGRGFDRHGEEAAWVHHSQMFTGLGRRAMTTETRGQNSAFIWINDGRQFPEQKAILLPDWVSVIPERWTR